MKTLKQVSEEVAQRVVSELAYAIDPLQTKGFTGAEQMAADVARKVLAPYFKDSREEIREDSGLEDGPRCMHCGGKFYHVLTEPLPDGTMCLKCAEEGHTGIRGGTKFGGAMCPVCRVDEGKEPLSPVATLEKDSELDVFARAIIKRVSDAAIELAFVRHGLTGDEFDEDDARALGVAAYQAFVDDIKADVLGCITGDDSGCLDPEDLDGTNCELIWLKGEISRTSVAPQDKVGQALSELRKMLPDCHARITFCDDIHEDPSERRYCQVEWINSESGEDDCEIGATLTEAIANIRQWKQEQK